MHRVAESTPLPAAAARPAIAVLILALCAGGPAGARGAAAPGGAAPGFHAAARDAEHCAECHAAEPGLGHPVDVAPSMGVPAELPLASGRLTCLTCHDPGSLDRGGAALRSAASASGLCAACHDPRDSSPAGIHAVAGEAHEAWPRRRASPQAPAAGSGALDDVSAACLSCHDGSLAPDVGYRLGPPQGPPSWARLAARHPIGVAQGPRFEGDTLRAPATLDRRVRLFDGSVGCGSCHSLYARTPDLLVMPNDGSRLCLACHDF